MISVIILVCALDNSECVTIQPQTFFTQTSSCEATVELLKDSAKSNGGYIVSHRCINWGAGT